MKELAYKLGAYMLDVEIKGFDWCNVRE